MESGVFLLRPHAPGFDLILVRPVKWTRCRGGPMRVGRLVFFLLCALLAANLAAQSPPPDDPAVSGPLKIQPPKLDFGSQATGTAGAPAAITLTNTGNSPIRILDITASGIDFNESTSCGEEISPGAACQVQIVFKPATTGDRYGVLSVMVSSTGPPYYVGLRGVGL